MKTRLTALVALLLLGVSAYAQEDDPPFVKQFSVEIATGFPPIHTLLEINGTKYDKSFARDGKEPDMNGAWMPALSVSAVWKTARRWEMVRRAALPGATTRSSNTGPSASTRREIPDTT